MPNTKTVAEILDERQRKADQGPWIPGTGETPFTSRGGVLLLWCWQPSTGNKAYLDVRSDLFLTDEEARNILG
jgi:hypothetical protein